MHKRVIPFASAVFFIVLFFAGTIQAQEQDYLKTSAEAANQWLSLLDQKKYPESWDAGSLTLKLTVPKKHWMTLMDGIRKPMGKVTKRELIDQRKAQDPSGLPKGEYMVLFYKTAFSGKDNAHELLTLVRESDGQWRVLTYQVQ